MVRLSKNFTLEELTATTHRNIDNHAPAEIVAALTDTAERMERVRALLGDRVITVSSGYRCRRLNNAVGGARKSAHLFGQAVDFNVYSLGSPLYICRLLAATDLEFDQMIEEGTWVHLSFAPAMRRSILTKRPNGGYIKGLR